MFDGFYSVCTNLEGDVKKIIKENHKRWEIEEGFRIMKSEFNARPVYLRLEERIKAHFITCFISLMIFRILEKKLDNKYTCSEIINTLKDMNIYKLNKNGYLATYTRIDLTDDLHEVFDFRTDLEIITHKEIKKISKSQESEKSTTFSLNAKTL